MEVTQPHEQLSLPLTGIDRLLKDVEKIESLKEKRVALLANQSSLTSSGIPSGVALQRILGESVCFLLAPEHGWSAEVAEGEDIDHSFDSATQLPVYSLYGPLFEKSVTHLQGIECLIIDIQDVGLRCYTYAATCAQLLERLSPKVEIILCDRPNPLGSTVSGPGVKPGYQSLVSYLNIPFQHGQTMGQLLEHHNSALSSPHSFMRIPFETPFDPTLHTWIPPSPNLQDWEALFLYPSLVLLEGTNISEGRGTPFPFKCIAAPGLDSAYLIDRLNAIPLKGIHAVPHSCTPQSGKLMGKLCQGVRLHVTNSSQIHGYELGVSLLSILKDIYPGFRWETSQDAYWIDFLTGSDDLRNSIDNK